MEVVTKAQTKEMGQRILKLFSDTLNSVAEEFEKAPRPSIRVFAPSTAIASLSSEHGDVGVLVDSDEGVWEWKLPSFGTWRVRVEDTDTTLYTRELYIDEVKRYYVALGVEVKRYGYRIKEAEPDPYERVEYILDAVGMKPVRMNFETGEFEYGSWADVWFVKENKPCMLRSDGTVDYYLDPNDYSKREDGSESDVENEEYDGNAMAQIPLVWIKRYEDEEYKYEIVSNVRYDESYKAYAHVRSDGTIGQNFYWSMYEASGDKKRLRSLSGKSVAGSISIPESVAGAQVNGARWSIGSWSRYQCLRTLMVLLGKSTNVQEVYGYGNIQGTEFLTSGTLDKAGQCTGSSETTKQVKVLHIEGLWGNKWKHTLGMICDNGEVWVKMTPEGGYSTSDLSEYRETGVKHSKRIIFQYISAVKLSELGMVCKEVKGSQSTYYSDTFYNNVGSKRLLGIGGAMGDGRAKGQFGVFSLNLANSTGTRDKNTGCSLTCEEGKG